jgi:3',5'-cyclic-AMP phosphodiesterase
MNSLVQPLAVLQLTDTHLLREAKQEMLGINTEKYFLKVMQQAFALNRHYDLMMITGDLTQNPCEESYQRLYYYLTPLALPVICLPGNHDNIGLMQSILNSANVSCKQQYLFDSWQIICLNSQIPNNPGGRLEDCELTLLEQCLADYPNHHAMIAVHHHCTPTNSVWMDTMMITNSQKFIDLVLRYPQAKVVITGHIHQCLTAQIQNLHILGTPSTCFQFTPGSYNFSMDRTAPGYREMLLYPDGHFETSVHRLTEELSELNLNIPGYFDD